MICPPSPPTPVSWNASWPTWSATPPGTPRTGLIGLTAGAIGGRVELRVADRGPGIPPADRERVFIAFQRLGDAPSGQGIGLGLAVARGLTEAMGGTLTAEETPGGGVTMVVSLAVASASSSVVPSPAPVAAS